MNLSAMKINQRLFFAFVIMLLLLIVTHPTFASSTSGGGLPFDDWLTKIRQSITGPFAFSVSIIGLVAAGSALIFGGDMNGFLRTLIFMVLVLAFVIAAQNTLSAITGQGAEITSTFKSQNLRTL